jgi:hypothetical protein
MDPVTGGGISILNLFKEGSSETERYIDTDTVGDWD